MKGEGPTIRSAALFVAAGAVCIYGATILGNVGTVVAALGGTFVFAGIAAYALGSERTLPFAVAASYSKSVRENQRALVDEFGLSDEPVYVPRTDRIPTATVVFRQSEAVSLPDESAGLGVFTTPDGELGGLSLYPAGADLFDQFERTLVTEVSHQPERLAVQLAESITEGFELADEVVPTVERDETTLQFEVKEMELPDDVGFDHVVQSFLATGVAHSLDCPVVARTNLDGDDAVVVCRPVDVETSVDTTRSHASSVD
jgi:hypothetical protein